MASGDGRPSERDPEVDGAVARQSGVSPIASESSGTARGDGTSRNGRALRETGETLKDRTPRAVPGEISGRLRAEQTVEVVRNDEDGTDQAGKAWGFRRRTSVRRVIASAMAKAVASAAVDWRVDALS